MLLLFLLGVDWVSAIGDVSVSVGWALCVLAWWVAVLWWLVCFLGGSVCPPSVLLQGGVVLVDFSVSGVVAGGDGDGAGVGSLVGAGFVSSVSSLFSLGQAVARLSICVIWMYALVMLSPYVNVGTWWVVLSWRMVSMSIAVCRRYSSVVTFGKGTLWGNQSTVRASRMP